MKLESQQLPEGVEAFAKAVAEMAKAQKIERFSMEFEPKFEHGDPRRYEHGKFQIVFYQTDGRGRPSENLEIQLSTTLKLKVTSNPESFS